MKMWKKLTAILCIFSLVAVTGCATRGAQTVDANYSAYLAALQAQFVKEEKPMVDLELHDDGKVKGLKVWREPKFMPVEQKRPDPPHPGWATLNGLIRVGGIIGGIWAAGDALEGVLDSVNHGGTTNNFGSYNSAGGDLAGGPIDLTDSFNTTTFRDVGGASQAPVFPDIVNDNSQTAEPYIVEPSVVEPSVVEPSVMEPTVIEVPTVD
jgi:hypothetical protein